MRMPSGEGFSPDALVPVDVANKISIKEPGGSYLQELLPSRDLKNGVFVFKAKKRSAAGDLPLQLEVIDFRNNKKVGSFAFPADGCKICGLSPDSSRLVSKSNARPLSGGKSRIDIWKISGDKLVFSDDGTRLATRGTNNDSTVLLGFDIASGATIFEMLVPVTKGNLTWSGDNYLLIGGSAHQIVIDVLSAGPLLRYKNRNYGTVKFIGFGDQTFGLVNNRNGTSATIERLPDPKDLGADFNFDELYYQFKANQVSIDISQLEVDLISSGRIKTRLEKHVTDLGGQIVDNADLKIVARVKKGNRRSEEFTQGSGGNAKSVSIEYTPYLNEITITMQDRVIWKTQVTTGGVSSFGTALSLQLQANASSKPSPEFFLETKLPIRVPRSDVWKKAIPTISR